MSDFNCLAALNPVIRRSGLVSFKASLIYFSPFGIFANTQNARARILGFTAFRHNFSNSGTASLPISCKAIQACLLTARFGFKSALIAPAGVS